MNPDSTFTINGWPVSPYTQKTLAYLKFKGIPYRSHAPGVLSLIGEIKRNVGRAVMPTMVTPDGEWWQDSSEIIDRLEQQFRENPVIPETPKQKMAAYLLELHGDEWLILSALHYRWSEPESDKFIVGEFGRLATPWLPAPLNKLVGRHIKKMMKAYMPRFGIAGEAGKGVRNYTEQLIAALEQHFSIHPYLLGNRPCIGDFAIFGSMYAHLYRDPGSRFLFDKTPHLVRWIERLLRPNEHLIEPGKFLEDDQVPETLNPVFKIIFSEQIPYLEKLIDAINQYLEKNPTAHRLPRIIGETNFRIGEIDSRRQLFTFAQWKLQRVIDCCPPQSIDQEMAAWLTSIGGEKLTQINCKRRIMRSDHQELLATI